MRFPDRGEKGFTLAELLVVIVILGVLAAVAVPLFLNQSDRAEQAALEADMASALSLLNAAQAIGATLPSSMPANTVTVIPGVGGIEPAATLTVSGSGDTLCVEGMTGSGDTYSANLSEGLRNYDCDGYENGSDVIVVSYPVTAFTQGVAGQTVAPTIRGGRQDRVYTVTGTLPEGVTFNSGTGLFSGPSAEEWNFQAEYVTGKQNYACALTVQGGVKCWGRNNWGQLGDGTTVQRSEPVDVVGLNTGVAQVAASNDRTCALLDSGLVKCWGYNGYGQIGDGTTTASSVPVTATVVDGDVESIAVASHTTCVLYTDGRVECWGANYGGQLGRGTIGGSSKVAGEVTGFAGAVASLYDGFSQLCAVLVSGHAQCWGGNNYGQLGDGTTQNRGSPVYVVDENGDPLTGVESMALGGSHTCAVLESGGVKCWGQGSSGRIGDGFEENRNHPTDVVGLGSGVAVVSAGSAHACALLDSGSVKCWGHNSDGRLGDGTLVSSSVPVDVTGSLSGVVSVATGSLHTCVVLDTSAVKCWGRNYYAEIGDGSRLLRRTPVDVLNSGVHPGFPATVNVTVEDGNSSATTSVTLTLV